MNKPSVCSELKRTLGLPSLVAIAVGVVVAQVVFVSILQGVGFGGSSFFVALIIAFILTLCYVFTFSELAVMLPKAGGLSSYTEVSIGHFPAIVATIAGYIAPAMFGLPAEIFLLEHILDILYPGMFGQAGVTILIVFAVLNVIGVDLFSKAQNLLAYLMMASLLIIGMAGLIHTEPNGSSITLIFEEWKNIDLGVFGLTLLALWAFFGLEFVCPLAEEMKNPAKNLPRSMIGAAVLLLLVYLIVALAGYRMIPANELTGSDIPHWILVLSTFGESGKLIMAILAITATCSTINTVIATLSRMLFGMAHNHQLPKIFMKIHPRTKAPWVGIVFVAAVIGIPAIIFRGAEDIILIMMISAGTIWLVAYIIAHLDLIVLRVKYPLFDRPFKTPFYPIPQIVGIIGMIYMILNNSPTPEMTIKVYLNAGLILIISGVYAWIWVKYKMKRNLFESEPLDKALSD